MSKTLSYEKELISFILKNKDSNESLEILSKVKPDIFFFKEHKELIQALLNINKDNKLGLLNKELLEDYLKKIDSDVTTEKILEIARTRPCIDYDKIINILDKSKKAHDYITSLKRIILEVETTNITNISDLINDTECALDKLTSNNYTEQYSLLNTKECIQELKDTLNKPQLHFTISAGFNNWDANYPLYRGDLILVAARTSMGKTAFTLNMFVNQLQSNVKAVFITLEMPPIKLLLRMLSIATGIKSKIIREKTYNMNEHRLIDEKLEEWKDKVFYVKGGYNNNLSQIKTTISRLKRTGDLDVVYIDYLGLVISKELTKSKRDKQSIYQYVVNDLKQLAIQYNIVIVLVHQLNRGVNKREDKRPNMDDLRDSGEIEQAADQIVMLHSDDYYNKDRKYLPIEKKQMVSYFEKAREHGFGKLDYEFEGSTQRFFPIMGENN